MVPEIVGVSPERICMNRPQFLVDKMFPPMSFKINNAETFEILQYFC
jgi:hypothetical protein